MKKCSVVGMLQLMLVLCMAAGISGCMTGSTDRDRLREEEVVKQDQPAANTQETLTVLTNRIDLIENGVLKRYAERFEQEHPGVQVEFEGLTNYAADIMVRLSTRSMGDVLLLPTNLMAQDLPAYFEPLPEDMFQEMRFADYKSYNGNRYGIATGATTDGIVYNKRAFEQAGITDIPQTLEAFYEACEKLKRSGIIPIYINYGAQWPMKLWGEDLVSFRTGDAGYLNAMALQDAPWQLDNPWGESISIVRTLIDRGYAEEDLIANNWEKSKTDLAEGRAGMYFMGNWVISQVIDAGAAPEDIGFFPFPYDNNPDKRYAPLVADWFIGVSKFSGSKQLAEEWVEYFVKKSGYVDDGGFLPVRRDAAPELPQFQEFLTYSPVFVESEPPSDLFLEVAEQARISFWSGDYIQELIVAEDLSEAFAQFNVRWREARRGISAD
ncbi:ABC transporter substrate-binding protein [Paenibacillus tarimensis]|uniref:ABC transporter substrate-binding protein n=1 Tax=Paenibacillus tarimensis TaxID=416012 RepID=UPI001F2A87A0|nr:ABC transporter substrate-binding protein [Paenibacillus tarimensis]MCF2943683.1 ABC transporter substrate-binding protein [Paenibacillus tarimensis]